VGVVVRNSAKLLSIWRKVKRKALLMEFLGRNYRGIVFGPKKFGGGREVDTNVGS
jgi:hypothetical protein